MLAHGLDVQPVFHVFFRLLHCATQCNSDSICRPALCTAATAATSDRVKTSHEVKRYVHHFKNG